LIVLSFDLGASLGWSILSDGKVVEAGVVKLKEKAPGANHYEVKEVFEELRVQALQWSENLTIAVEDVVFAKFRLAYKAYVEKRTVLEMCCTDWEYPLHLVHTATLKKHATGSGKASKSEMVKAAQEVFKGQVAWPSNKTKEDMADAIWVGHYVWNKETNGKFNAQVKDKSNSRAGSTTRSRDARLLDELLPDAPGDGSDREKPNGGQRRTRCRS
jgi:Holliday junction resolvasome RuvABC endonuclease subunit